MANLIDTISNWFRREATQAGPSKASSPRTGSSYVPDFGNNPLNVATVFRCVNLIAESVASLPLQYLRMKNGIFVVDEASRLNYLLNVEPSPVMSAVDMWRQAVQYILLRGNAYIVPIWDTASAELSRLALVNPGCVMYDTAIDTYAIDDSEAGISGVFDESEIIHLKNYTLKDGKVGLSTIGFARLSLNIASAGDKETLKRFTNGGNVRGILSNDTSVRGFGEFQDTEIAKAAVDLDAEFRSGQNIVSVPGSVQFTGITPTSADMQFLETRKFSTREICRFFGVHPSFVFDDTSNNYKSAEMANVAFLSNTLNPILRRIEVELLRKLVAPTLVSKRRFQFNRAGLYACDLDSKIRYQTQRLAAGLSTVNELRREENMPPVEGGDAPFVSANLKRLDEFNQQPNNDGKEQNNNPPSADSE